MEGRDWHSGRTRNCPKGHFSSSVCSNCEPARSLSDCRRSCPAPSPETPVLCLVTLVPRLHLLVSWMTWPVRCQREKPSMTAPCHQKTDFMVLLLLAIRLRPKAWYRWAVGEGRSPSIGWMFSSCMVGVCYTWGRSSWPGSVGFEDQLL